MGWQELARKKKTGANGFSAYKRINNVDEMIMVEKGAWLGCGQM